MNDNNETNMNNIYIFGSLSSQNNKMIFIDNEIMIYVIKLFMI